MSITEPLFELADVGEPQVDRRGVDVLEQALAAADDHQHDSEAQLVDEAHSPD